MKSILFFKSSVKCAMTEKYQHAIRKLAKSDTQHLNISSKPSIKTFPTAASCIKVLCNEGLHQSPRVTFARWPVSQSESSESSKELQTCVFISLSVSFSLSARTTSHRRAGVRAQSRCAISNPLCSCLCVVAQQEVGAGQTTINKRAVKNTISHQ